MARVYTQGDDAFVVDTQSGETIRIKRDLLSSALSGGFLPADKAQVTELQKTEKYGGTGAEIAAGAAGAARAITFGLSDPLIRHAGLASAEELRLLQELNPRASGAGEIAGTAASLLIPGGPLGAVGKGTARLGKAVAGKTAQLTGRAAESFVPRLAGNVAREAAFGGAIGLGQGVSDLALSDKEMTASEQALSLLAHAGKSAMLGGAIGAAQTGLGSAWRYAKSKRKTLDIAGMSRLSAQKKHLTSELESLEASAADPERIATLADKLDRVTQELGARQSHAFKTVASRAIAMGVGGAIGGMPGGILGYAIAPRVYRSLAKALTPLGSEVKAAWKALRGKTIAASGANMSAAQSAATALRDATEHLTRATQEAETLAQKIGLTSEKAKTLWDSVREQVLADAPVTSSMGTLKRRITDELKKRTTHLESQTARQYQNEIEAFVDRASAKLPKKIIDKVHAAASRLSVEGTLKSAEVVGGTVGGILTTIGSMTPEVVAQGALHGGLHGLMVGSAIHLGRQPLRKIADMLVDKIVPIGKVAAHQTSALDVQKLLEQTESSPEEIEAALRMSMPANAPPKLVEPVVQQTMSALTYMLEQASKGAPHVQTALVQVKPRGDKKEQSRALRNIRAVVEPDSVLHAFGEGKLTAGQIDAWSRVYPAALGELRALVQAEVDRASASGKHFSRRQAEQIALLLGDHTLAPRMYDPAVAARLQESYKRSREKAARTERSSLRLSRLHRTTMQRIGEQ